MPTQGPAVLAPPEAVFEKEEGADEYDETAERKKIVQGPFQGQQPTAGSDDRPENREGSTYYKKGHSSYPGPFQCQK